MRKWLILLFAGLFLFTYTSCDKNKLIDGDKFNLFLPTTSHVGAEGGEIIVKAEAPMNSCSFILSHIAVYEHEKDENGKYVYLETLDVSKKWTKVMHVSDSSDLGQVSVKFADANTLVLTVAPCDEDKHLNIDITVSNTGTDGQHFAPGVLIILQNE